LGGIWGIGTKEKASDKLAFFVCAVGARPHVMLSFVVLAEPRKFVHGVDVRSRVQPQQALPLVVVQARRDPAAVRPEDKRGVDVPELRRDVERVRAQHQEA
jgi:hypothetical protein